MLMLKTRNNELVLSCRPTRGGEGQLLEPARSSWPRAPTVESSSSRIRSWSARTACMSRWGSGARRSGTGTCRARTCCCRALVMLIAPMPGSSRACSTIWRTTARPTPPPWHDGSTGSIRNSSSPSVAISLYVSPANVSVTAATTRPAASATHTARARPVLHIPQHAHVRMVRSEVPCT